jgi:hypothetical protein
MTAAILVRLVVETVLEFKEIKDVIFYALLILRKIVNISLITILSISIRQVL